MAWVTPVTNRADKSTRTTHADMNRIAGNINFLLSWSEKADYVLTDIVTNTQWAKLMEGMADIADSLSMTAPTSSTDYANLNYIEQLCLLFHDNAMFPADNLYPADDLYPMRRTI